MDVLLLRCEGEGSELLQHMLVGAVVAVLDEGWTRKRSRGSEEEFLGVRRVRIVVTMLPML